MDRQHLLSALCGSGNGWRAGETPGRRETERQREEKLGKKKREEEGIVEGKKQRPHARRELGEGTGVEKSKFLEKFSFIIQPLWMKKKNG